MPTRRRVLQLAAVSGAGMALCPARSGAAGETIVNDIHAQLNATKVDWVVAVDSIATLRDALVLARAAGKPVCIAGGHHAMGGQRFARDSVLLDMRGLNRILSLDRGRGTVEAEAGIEWLALIEGLLAMQAGEPQPWSIIQKQTGADRLTLGDALAANIHGATCACGRSSATSNRSRSWMRTDGSTIAAARKTPSCSGWRSAATACSASSPGCASG